MKEAWPYVGLRYLMGVSLTDFGIADNGIGQYMSLSLREGFSSSISLSNATLSGCPKRKGDSWSADR
jgi:hypothetical protein